MEYLAIIQARYASTRLPGKVLKDLSGKPALVRMVERVRRSRFLDEVVVATSIEETNLPVVRICAENEIRVFVGSEDDVLDRVFQAAKLFRPKYVVRLTADCPCFDPALLDEAISELEPESDYLGMMSETFPDGLDFEVMSFEALRAAWREAKLASQREHVTQFIVNNKARFRCQDFESKIGYHGDERWTVDEPEDYELVSQIYGHFVASGDDALFSYGDVIGFLDERPNLRKINDRFARNEGLAKSLREDRTVAWEGE